MVWTARFVVVVLALLGATPLHAVQVDEILPDPALEGRARDISHELRCMVCQNQSIDDSEAPLARDLRLLVRERLTKGDSDQQVFDFMVSRYGEFVLLKPRLEWHTLVLWGLPPAALIAGTLSLLLMARRPSRAGRDVEPLSQEEARRLATLVDPATRER